MIWSSTFRLDKDNRSRWHTCTCDQKWCWIWWGEQYNKYARTTADWAENRNWDSSLSRLFSLPPIHCFSSLLCLKLSLPTVFHIRSQANKRKHVNRHTHVYTHTLTHTNIAQCALVSFVDTQGHYNVSSQCSDSDEFQLFNCHTHTGKSVGVKGHGIRQSFGRTHFK